MINNVFLIQTNRICSNKANFFLFYFLQLKDGAQHVRGVIAGTTHDLTVMTFLLSLAVSGSEAESTNSGN